MKSRRLLYLLLFLLGSLQIVGVAIGSRAIKSIGLASAASPLPLVFSHFRGIETFAVDFRLRLKRKGHTVFDAPITSTLYKKLEGPYNRRNIYGAVFAYGPVLTQPSEKVLVNSVLKQGLCPGRPLVQEFGLPKDFDEVEIEVHSNTKDKEQTHRFGVYCS
ncbi:MAG: hypothetical protein OEZ51_14360 [Nitrospinota bacterium]|nr:hypothetical protein [Nitrospinota bacterium]